jgi:chromosome segregation protein
MNRIQINEVELEGFGLYNRPTTFSFTSGMNVFIAPNEAGKSTFLSGLLATLFGLPEKNDPESWGTGRYRNWQHPIHFRGKLQLRADDSWHQIRRDFATHQVQWNAAAVDSRDPLGKPLPDGWQILFAEEHNPAGRGEPVRRYQKQLQDLIGISDRDLFLLTYCVLQDPEDRKDEDIDFRTRRVPESIQGLISGSGGQVDGILTQLFEEYGAITMYTGDAGLIRPGKTKPMNLRKDGRLEEIRKALKSLRGKLAGAEINLEDLQGSQERLDDLRRNADACRVQLTGDERLKESWEKWARARKDQRHFQRQVVSLENAAGEQSGRQKVLLEKEDALKQTYGEYLTSNFPFEERERELSEVIEADKQRTALNQELEETRQRSKSLGEKIEKYETEINEGLIAFKQNPDLARDFDEWHTLNAQVAKLEGQLAELNQAEADQRQIRDAGKMWARLRDEINGPEKSTPASLILEKLRDEAPKWLVSLDDAMDLGDEREELTTRLEGPLSGIVAASEADRSEAAAYAERLTLYRMEAEDSRRNVSDLTSRREELERKEARARELESDLHSQLGGMITGIATDAAVALGLDLHEAHKETIQTDRGEGGQIRTEWDSAKELIRRKLTGLQEEANLLRRIDSAQESIRAGLIKATALPALGALALIGGAMIVVGGLMDLGGAITYGLGIPLGLVAAGAAGYFVHHKNQGSFIREARSARGRLSSVRRTLIELDGQLGSLATLPVAVLEELLDKIREFQRISGELTSLRSFAPSSEELTAAKGKAELAANDLARFEKQMAEIGDEPQVLVAEWKMVAKRLEEIERELHRLDESLGTLDWHETALSNLPESWQDRVTLTKVVCALLPDSPTPSAPQNGNDVASILSRIDDQMWESWLTEAIAYETAENELKSLNVRRSAFHGDTADTPGRLEQLTARTWELATACSPFTLETPLETIAAGAERFKNLHRELERTRTLHDELVKKIPARENRLKLADAKTTSLRDSLRGLLQPAGGTASAARDRLLTAQQLRNELTHAYDALKQVLSSHDVSDITDLQIKLEQAREENRQVSETISRLETEFKALQELGEASAIEVQNQQNELAQRISKNRTTLQDLADERDRVQKLSSKAEAEGELVGNAAVLELEITQLEAEEKRLTMDREALRIAFDTLREAETQFAGSYRKRLEERARQIFSEISLKPERLVQFSDRFDIQVAEANGQSCQLRQLSQGARDQLALALRLAVAELLSDTAAPPLLLDDPFLAFDPQRLKAVRETLERLAQDRQIILLSHRPELGEWGPKVCCETR